jgi:hypothetical protein
MEVSMAADTADPGSPAARAAIVLTFAGWSWRSYTGTVPAALVALDSQVFFPGDVAHGFRFELNATPGSHSLTVILGGNSRTITIEVAAGERYDIPLRFGGRWGALKIDFPSHSDESAPA